MEPGALHHQCQQSLMSSVPLEPYLQAWSTQPLFHSTPAVETKFKVRLSRGIAKSSHCHQYADIYLDYVIIAALMVCYSMQLQCVVVDTVDHRDIYSTDCHGD